MMRLYKAHKGFTLIETLVVLGILILLLTIVPPYFPNAIDNSKLKAASRTLFNELKTIRHNAISEQKEKRLIIDIENKQYIINKKQKKLDIPKDTELKVVTAKTELEEDNKGAIRFYPDGSSTGGQITLSRKEHVYTIDVNWLTGKVSVF